MSHVDDRLSDYLDGTLTPEEQHVVEQHLATCRACRAEFARLRDVVAELHTLPRSLEPPRDLWARIEARIAPAARAGASPAARASAPRAPLRARKPSFIWRRQAAVVAVILLIGLGVLWWRSVSSGPAWGVTTLAGEPRIGEATVAESGRLRVGEWLETGTDARARLLVGEIGNVELAPDTRLQLGSAEPAAHRLVLAEGRIHARIWAPPRQFFVDTPAGLAVDLGCEYTLEVDSSGSSVLHVLSGYVGFVRATREVIVPAGWMVRARPDRRTGTPFSVAASLAFRDALMRFDFDGGGTEALAEVLSEARRDDALTLWELVARTEGSERDRVYDRLVGLLPPPPEVSRAGVLARDPVMIQAWRQHLGVDVTYWLSEKKKRLQEAP